VRLSQLSDRPEIQVELFRGDAEVAGEVVDGFFELHQGDAELFDLVGSEGLLLHAADGLALHELAQELDEGEDELGYRALDVFGGGVPAGDGLRGESALELDAEVLQLLDFQAQRLPLAQGRTSGAKA
jgi:hypothetical protein